MLSLRITMYGLFSTMSIASFAGGDGEDAIASFAARSIRALRRSFSSPIACLAASLPPRDRTRRPPCVDDAELGTGGDR